jgi:hypothetical protein
MNSMAKIIFLSLVCLTFACRSNEEPQVHPIKIMKYTDLGPPPSIPNYSGVSVGALDQIPVQQRMIIKTARLDCEVSDYEQAFAGVQKIVTEAGGFIVSSSTQSSGSNAKSGTIQLRIPSAQFDATLESVSKLSSRVLSKSISGNDVTEEYFDVNARLENKRKVESRFREILKSAKSVKDVLEVEKSLGEVREDIDRLEGRRKFLADQTAFSTITTTLQEPKAIVAIEGEGFWGTIASGFRLGIRGFVEVLSFCITVLIAAIPVIVILFVLAWIVFKIVRSIKLRRPQVLQKEAAKKVRSTQPVK